MHISPTIHYNAGHSYKMNTHYNTGADEFVAWKKFSPWEGFFVNPFGSVLTNYVSVHVCISVQVLVEAHAVEL